LYVRKSGSCQKLVASYSRTTLGMHLHAATTVDGRDRKRP
jgi:hypothetical protein